MPMQKISTLSKKCLKRTYSKSTDIGIEPNRNVLKNILAFSNSIEAKKSQSGLPIFYLLN